jgi:hypothetical protein
MTNPKLKYLEDVPWDNSLKLSNGKIVHDLEQLPMVIKFSDDDVFYSHVTSSKNDFANWIRDVIHDDELANQLLSIQIKEEFLTFMEQAIADIKTYKEPEPVIVPALPPANSPVIQPEISPVPVVPSVVESVPASIIVPVSQPAVSPPIISASPVPSVTPVVTSIISSHTNSAVAPSLVPVSPLSVPSVASVSPSITAVSPIDTSIVSLPIPSVDSSVSSVGSIDSSTVPVNPVVDSVSVNASAPIEETFEYEEIFKVLINELEQEVLAWDTQTS